MKKWKRILLDIGCGILLGAWACSTMFAGTATGSFTYDFTVDPACSATVTADCIDHFEIWDFSASPTKKLATVPLPATPSTTGPMSVPFQFKVTSPYGARTWGAIAVAKDSTQSDNTKARAVIQVRPGAPGSFTIDSLQ